MKKLKNPILQCMAESNGDSNITLQELCKDGYDSSPCGYYTFIQIDGKKDWYSYSEQSEYFTMTLEELDESEYDVTALGIGACVEGSNAEFFDRITKEEFTQEKFDKIVENIEREVDIEFMKCNYDWFYVIKDKEIVGMLHLDSLGGLVWDDKGDIPEKTVKKITHEVLVYDRDGEWDLDYQWNIGEDVDEEKSLKVNSYYIVRVEPY